MKHRIKDRATITFKTRRTPATRTLLLDKYSTYEDILSVIRFQRSETV